MNKYMLIIEVEDKDELQKVLNEVNYITYNEISEEELKELLKI